MKDSLFSARPETLLCSKWANYNRRSGIWTESQARTISLANACPLDASISQLMAALCSEAVASCRWADMAGGSWPSAVRGPGGPRLHRTWKIGAVAYIFDLCRGTAK